MPLYRVTYWPKTATGIPYTAEQLRDAIMCGEITEKSYTFVAAHKREARDMTIHLADISDGCLITRVRRIKVKA